MDALNEKLCDRTERAIPESYDADGPRLRRELDWKNLERLRVVAKAQNRSRKRGHKPRVRGQPAANMN